MTVKALSSLAHSGGESLGTETKFRRVKIIGADGNEAEVPEVSGNAMRGLMRDLIHSHLCQSLGYGEEGKGLSLPAFHFLFSGGSLHSSSLGINTGYYAKLRELIPSVSVWGGGVGNALLPGKLKCGALVLVCAENAERLCREHAVLPQASNSMWSYLDVEMNTRKDDSKNPHRQTLIEPVARLMLQSAADAKQSKKASGEDRAEDRGAATQMMYQTEVIAAGSIFSWRVSLEDVTDIEWEVFLVALAELARKPWVGGKSGTGHGEIEIKVENADELNQRIAPATQAISTSVAGRLYFDHVASRATEIREILENMQ